MGWKQFLQILVYVKGFLDIMLCPENILDIALWLRSRMTVIYHVETIKGYHFFTDEKSIVILVLSMCFYNIPNIYIKTI